MLKKFALMLLMPVAFIFSLSASSWSVEGSLGGRKSSIDGIVPEVSVAGIYDGFYFGLMAGGKDFMAFDASFDHEAESSFRSTVGTSLSYHYGTGGLFTLHGDVGQDFRPWGWLDLRYRAGVQLGLSWADGIEHVPFSASPYAKWLIGYNDDVFSFGFYGTGMRRFEHTFQAPPVLGTLIGWNINEHHKVELDSFWKLADYMDGADLIITDLCVRLTYTWKEGEA